MSLFDNLQDRIDTLALSIFQAVHATSTKTDSESVKASIETVCSNYDSVLEAIDSLDDRSSAEQIELIASLNAEYAHTRERISQLESDLKNLLSNTELKMGELVTNIEESQSEKTASAR